MDRCNLLIVVISLKLAEMPNETPNRFKDIVVLLFGFMSRFVANIKGSIGKLKWELISCFVIRYKPNWGYAATKKMVVFDG